MKNPDTHATPSPERAQTVNSASLPTNAADERVWVLNQFAELICDTLNLTPGATKEEMDKARKKLYGDAGTDLPDSPALKDLSHEQ